jgi:hypothetical protein
VTASEILDALIATSDDKIWASELALLAGGRRVDFWTLEPAASRGFRAQAYEIKISRGDFKRDSEDKQEGALSFADRFWYVTPPGLLKKEEIPTWAGLQEWDGKLFNVRRKAPMRQKREPDWEFVVSLLRNSGDQRRDVGLLKAQVAFFQANAEQNRRQRTIAASYQMERWVRKATHARS